MSEKKISGLAVRLNTAMAGVFDDEMSGLRLDIFTKGEKGVIPDCLDEKLVVIKKAIECGILILGDGCAIQTSQRTNIVDNSANIETECVDILLFGRDKLQDAIKKETNLDRLNLLTTLETKGKNRVSVLRPIKARINSVRSDLKIQGELAEKEYQINNITEKLDETEPS